MHCGLHFIIKTLSHLDLGLSHPLRRFSDRSIQLHHREKHATLMIFEL